MAKSKSETLKRKPAGYGDPDRHWVISFGPALRLMSERYFIDEMHLSKFAFRSLCKALRVPMIEVGNCRLLDPVQFMIAMKAACRIGQPSLFLFPGSYSKGHRYEQFEERLEDGEYSEGLDPQYVKENLTNILAELIYSKDNLTLSGMEEALKYAKQAADRLFLAGIAQLPAEEQARYDKETLKHLQRKFGPPPSEVIADFERREREEAKAPHGEKEEKSLSSDPV